MKIKNKKIFTFFTAIIWQLLCLSAIAEENRTQAVLPVGTLEITGTAGAAALQHDYHFVKKLSIRLGVVRSLELAGPAALSIKLADLKAGGMLYFALGVIDLHFNSDGKLLYEPALFFAGEARFGRQAAFRGAVDIVGAEKGVQRGKHSLWLRGSAALLLDLGRAATLAFGISYQRILKDGTHHPEIPETGWAGDSRVSIGSVRTQPFRDLPLLSIHMQPGFDFILITRFDLNADSNTSDVRCLLGFSILLVSDKH